MRKIANIGLALLLLTSTLAAGCFVSRTKEVREVPTSSTTRVERSTSVETAPDVTHRETTVERRY